MICQQNREGSFGTIAARQKVLIQSANQIEALGFRQLKSATQLKPKHIHALVQSWREADLSHATMKNRMAHLRWLAGKIQNPNLLSPSNEHYSIEQRQYVDNKDKSLVFETEKLNSIRDPHIKISAQLQKEFGLRREEAMKLVPVKADQKTQLVLQGSWTKGGKPRSIPIRTDAQRAILDKAHALAGNGSMIPSARKYVQHMRIFEKEMHAAGLGKTHGARHLYAQRRYQELTARPAPVAGGPSRRSLTAEQRKHDDQCRLIISRELGHERIQIVSVYVGS